MEYTKQIRFIVPEDFDSNEKGKFFENVISQLLRKQRFKVTERIKFTGMETDVLADNNDTGQRAFVECKFQKESISAGVITDLLGKALIHDVPIVYLFTVSQPGMDAKGIIDQYKNKKKSNGPMLAFIGPDDILDFFMDVNSLNYPTLEHLNIPPESIGSITLVVSPEYKCFWVIEETRSGTPYRAIIKKHFPITNLNIEAISSQFSHLGLWQGLELIEEEKLIDYKNKQLSVMTTDQEECITLINVADTFEDYRPCKPDDFVGRNELQQSIWTYLTNVIEGTTSTRIISLLGPSGYGKSSVILKLADRFKNIKWKNKFFLYPIDVRSARGPLFVAKAFKQALQKAVDDGFVEGINESISISSTESFLTNESVQRVLEALKTQKKVLIVFFDQFEELFSKEQLLSTFQEFQKLAFEVDALKANLVLGFSWRTGINFSDDHPAYFMWHNLKDKRREFRVAAFTTTERSALLTKFENKHIRQKLDRQLRTRLLEQCQGLPWLLKKLCIHIYRQLQKGVKQSALITGQFNIKPLFDEDLEPLTKEQIACLKFIAANSPADIIDVFEHFGKNSPDWLYNNRLIIRAGQKYAVYWDIFRDYLNSGVVPTIPLTYIPLAHLSTTIKTFNYIRANGPTEFSALAKALGYSEKTTMNIVSDLQLFLLVIRNAGNMYQVNDQLKEAKAIDIADFLAKQLKEHVVIVRIFTYLKSGACVSSEEFKEQFKQSYPNEDFTSNTIDQYVNRLLGWSSFAGLLELKSPSMVCRPEKIGIQKGEISSNLRGGNKGVPTFLCTSGPQQAVSMLQRLINERQIHSDLLKQLRNPVADLIALKLAQRNGKYVELSPEIKNIPLSPDVSTIAQQVVIGAARNSAFLKAIMSVQESVNEPVMDDYVRQITTEFDKKWSKASLKRYLTAGKTWVKFINTYSNSLKD